MRRLKRNEDTRLDKASGASDSSSDKDDQDDAAAESERSDAGERGGSDEELAVVSSMPRSWSPSGDSEAEQQGGLDEPPSLVVEDHHVVSFPAEVGGGGGGGGEGEGTGTGPGLETAPLERLREHLASAGVHLGDDTLFAPNSTTKARFVRQQHPLDVLEISQGEKAEFVQLRREDILREARQIVPPIGSKSQTRASLMTQMRGVLQYRDVQLLDPASTRSKEPGIVVRKHCVLIILPPVKALIFHNKTWMFANLAADGAFANLSNFVQALHDVAREDSKLPFSTQSLEAVFRTVSLALGEQVDQLAPTVRQTIANTVNKSSGVTVEKLRRSLSDVSKLSSRVVGVQDAFEDVLANDANMALMNLHKVHAAPDDYAEDRTEIWSTDHEEIELLLGNYLSAVDGSNSVLEVLRSDLDSAISTTSLRLDYARNRLLGLDLLVTSVTAAAGIGALFAGLFGMNLDSGFQEDPYWFWASFGLIVGSIPVIVSLVLWTIYRKGLLIT